MSSAYFHTRLKKPPRRQPLRRGRLDWQRVIGSLAHKKKLNDLERFSLEKKRLRHAERGDDIQVEGELEFDHLFIKVNPHDINYIIIKEVTEKASFMINCPSEK